MIKSVNTPGIYALSVYNKLKSMDAKMIRDWGMVYGFKMNQTEVNNILKANKLAVSQIEREIEIYGRENILIDDR